MRLLLICALLSQDAPDRVFSGPQKGEKTSGFKVLDLSGPHAGKEADYLSEWDAAPVLVCFIHELTRPGAQLIRRLDDYGHRNGAALRTLFVSLSDDVNQGERALPPAIKALSMKCPVGISLDGKEGPGAWGLNKKVTLTVVLARDRRVVGNWAIVSPNETDFPPIREALEKLLEPALDTPEALRAEVLRLRSEVSALRAELDELKRGAGSMAMGERPARPKRVEVREAPRKEEPPKPPAGKAPEDARLRELLRALIRPEATPADIDQVLEDIEARAGDDPALRKQAADGIVLVDGLGYGNDYSKSARKKLLEKYGK